VRSQGSKAAKEVEYQLSNFPVGMDANIVYGSSFGRAEYKPRHNIEDSGVASVEVGDRNNIDQPFNTLRRKSVRVIGSLYGDPVAPGASKRASCRSGSREST